MKVYESLLDSSYRDSSLLGKQLGLWARCRVLRMRFGGTGALRV